MLNKVYVYMYVYACMYTYVCMYVCMFVCMHVGMYTVVGPIVCMHQVDGSLPASFLWG